MPLSQRQLDAFADRHAWRFPVDTSPRYLAGAGDARHVTHGLAAAGWSRLSDPLSAELLMRSPDHRYRLQFDPQSPTSAWWRLRAEHSDVGPGWYAEFGELVPAEVLAGFTDALVAPAPAESTSPLPVLEAAGWLRDGHGIADSIPPGCKVVRLPETQPRGTSPGPEPDRVSWRVEVHDHPEGFGRGANLWHAWFDEHTPEHLVTAFVSALADPAPLQRWKLDRTAHHSVVQRPSPFTPQQTVEAHTARVNALRKQARAARKHGAQPATPPAPTSTVRPVTRR